MFCVFRSSLVKIVRVGRPFQTLSSLIAMQKHEVPESMTPLPSNSTPPLNESSPIDSPQSAPIDPQGLVDSAPPVVEDPPPSFVKLAMRNMVRKSGQSLRHFALTAMGLLGLLVGLAYLTR